MANAPLLSICIPTYNRAELLRLMLRSLLADIVEVGDEVELIVSDNCSTDATPEVVQWARQFGPLRYSRNERNLGCTRNMLKLVGDLARGEFCWVLGDDDLLLRGKLAKVLGALKANSDLDYVFVNYFNRPLAERNRLIVEEDSRCVPELEECMCRDLSDHPISRWEDIQAIDCRRGGTVFTSIVCHVFRRSVWCSHEHVLQLEDTDRPFYALDDTFPHIKVLAHALVGRPVYYVGEPCALLSLGAQEWIRHWPVLYLTFGNEVLELYQSLGVDRRRMRRFRRDYLRECGRNIRQMYYEHDLPRRDDFSLRTFIRQNRSCPIALGKALLPSWRLWGPDLLPRPVRLVVGAIRRTAEGFLRRVGLRGWADRLR